jgi:hypothetical protein
VTPMRNGPRMSPQSVEATPDRWPLHLARRVRWPLLLFVGLLLLVWWASGLFDSYPDPWWALLIEWTFFVAGVAGLVLAVLNLLREKPRKTR